MVRNCKGLYVNSSKVNWWGPQPTGSFGVIRCTVFFFFIGGMGAFMMADMNEIVQRGQITKSHPDHSVIEDSHFQAESVRKSARERGQEQHKCRK